MARAVLRGAVGIWLARKCLARCRSAARHACAAAACLQGAFRGRAARRRVEALRELKQRRQKAAVTIGRWVRGQQGRRFARDARQAAEEQGLFLERYRVVCEEPPGRAKSKAPRHAGAARLAQPTRPGNPGQPRPGNGPGRQWGLVGNGPGRQWANGQGPATWARPVRADGRAAEVETAAGGGPGRAGAPGLVSVRDGRKQVPSHATRMVKDGGRGMVAGLLAGQEEGWEQEGEGRFAAVDLKTQQQVLIRVVADTRQFERERQLQAVLDPRCPAPSCPDYPCGDLP